MQYKLDASGTNPITLETAKEWLKVTHSFEDTLIQAILDASLSFAEGYTGVSFRDQTWTLTASAVELASGIVISKTPLSSLTSVTVTLDDESTVVLTDDQYYLCVTESRAVLTITDGNVFNDISLKFNAVTIVFDVSNTMPSHINNAVKMLVAFMYENRGDAPTINNNSAPPEALKLLQLERVFQI